MKITIIGPVYPLKGGIAHYTGLLAASLQKEHDVEVVSFSLQYPKFLYKKEQRDYKNDAFKFENTRFMLSTMNPVSYFKTGRYIKSQKPDLVIFQWWHPYFAPAYWTILKMLGSSKPQIIFICHNVLPHENFPLQKPITKSILKKGKQIVHSEADAAILKSLIVAPDFVQTVLPAFHMFSTISAHKRTESQQSLSLSESNKVLLFFGFIREYKGLKHLIKAMPDIVKQLPECRLLVVGEYFEGNKEEYVELIEQEGMTEYIKVYDGYIPDSDVGIYFTACDLVVLPYESATQSGIVQIAYGFNKPVVATRVGGLPDVVTDGKTGYLISPFSSDAIANAVVKFFKEGRIEDFESGIEAERHKYSWDRMNEIVESLSRRA